MLRDHTADDTLLLRSQKRSIQIGSESQLFNDLQDLLLAFGRDLPPIVKNPVHSSLGNSDSPCHIIDRHLIAFHTLRDS